MVYAPSAVPVFLVAASWLLCQLGSPFASVALEVARRRVAVYRLRRKWARFRSQHPEEF